MTVPLNSLSFTSNMTLNWQALAQTVPGLKNALGNNNSFAGVVALGTSKADNASGGADTLFLQTLQIAASGTSTINLQNYVDACSQAAVAMVRLKSYFFMNLTAAYYSTIVTPATSVTIGNAGSNPFTFNWAGTTPTVTLLPGDPFGWATISAAGLTVDSTHKNILITNNDVSNIAYVIAIMTGGTA